MVISGTGYDVSSRTSGLFMTPSVTAARKLLSYLKISKACKSMFRGMRASSSKKTTLKRVPIGVFSSLKLQSSWKVGSSFM